ncbi:response regulator transcription factor [Asaia siamensis]|uniref:DNA-binding response regulator n=1 Tax=Asaia siamensis TaxID=110479 RepID=A0ABQ1M9C8_9PROT|nr:response regulator transcription factor [Asaia siamensis]GBR07578.1 two component response regulator [Asaia siamensis NRIC 0323]GGC36638.1 DNA-binding response regulator [Asaia siamensis]
MRILLIEDELDMAVLITRSVQDAGFAIDSARALADAREMAALASYALIILDRRLPDGDGLSLIRSLRTAQPGAPIIVLSALDAVPDRVQGLNEGADDYLAKPFDMAELLARARAALRRPGAEDTPPMICGRLGFHPSTREVTIDGTPVLFKRRELAVLETLIRRAGRVVRRETLIEEVYGFDDEIQSNTLDAHISRLRVRLTAFKAGIVIHPIRGVGYLLDQC